MQFSREENVILEALSMSEIMDSLDTHEKVIFLMLYYREDVEGYRDIASALGISKTTVTSRVKKIREKILVQIHQ